MATHIFLILCGLSVAFLVYVLFQFLREGHRAPKGAEPEVVFRRQLDPDVIAVTHRISLNAHGGISVLPRPPQVQGPEKKNRRGADIAEVLEMPARGSHPGRRLGTRSSEIKAR